MPGEIPGPFRSSDRRPSTTDDLDLKSSSSSRRKIERHYLLALHFRGFQIFARLPCNRVGPRIFARLIPHTGSVPTRFKNRQAPGCESRYGISATKITVLSFEDSKLIVSVIFFFKFFSPQENKKLLPP